jgi:hypothetical protein
MRRRQLVAAALTLVVIAVIGLLYLQAFAQTRAARDAWLVTRDVPAGTVLDPSSVKRVRIPSAGDQFTVLAASPLHRRAAHRLDRQTLLTDQDLLSQDTVQVPVSVRASPAVAAGDTLDVYAVVGNRTVLVGRHLVVGAAGNPMTLLVPAADEPSWVALQANNVSLFAAKSAGVGVPGVGGVAVNDAISNLSGSAEAGSVLTGGSPSPGASARPSLSPTPTATGTATPR